MELAKAIAEFFISLSSIAWIYLKPIIIWFVRIFISSFDWILELVKNIFGR